MTCHFEHDEAHDPAVVLRVFAVQRDRYGYPKADTKPQDFRPDLECCTPEEVLRWRAAMDQVEE
jgi:hypothetical protein